VGLLLEEKRAEYFNGIRQNSIIEKSKTGD
jgi:hypothetical protein